MIDAANLKEKADRLSRLCSDPHPEDFHWRLAVAWALDDIAALSPGKNFRKKDYDVVRSLSESV